MKVLADIFGRGPLKLLYERSLQANFRMNFIFTNEVMEMRDLLYTDAEQGLTIG